MDVQRLDFRFRTEPKSLFKIRNLVFPDNGLGCLLAHSGSGKTTLLRCLSGWFDCTNRVGEFAAATSFNRINETWFIGAHPRFLPWLDMRTNIRRFAQDPHSDAARSLADRLQLPSTAWAKHPQELSFGMYKRFELIAGLLRPTRLVLLDEFFTSLDDELKDLALTLLRNHQGERFFLCVTHEQAFAREYADFVYRWKTEDSTIVGLQPA